MRKFKFFQKEVKGDLTMLPGETRATASIRDWDTPEGHYNRRALYHQSEIQVVPGRITGLTEEEILRLRHQSFERMRNTNDDMERFFIGRDLNDQSMYKVVKDKPKSLYKKLIDWYQNNTETITIVHCTISFLITIIGLIAHFKK